MLTHILNINFREMVQLLNTHFERIIIFHIIWFLTILLVAVFAKVRGVKLKDIRRLVNRILYYGVMGGEVLLVVITLIVFITNIKEKMMLDKTYAMYVNATTQWVKGKFTIYFIKENQLMAIDTNGENRHIVFTSEDPIRSYHFSPDGKYLVIASLQNLYLYHLSSRNSERMASLSDFEKMSASRGVINGVRWSPDASQFCYRVARWSKIATADDWYIYDVKSKKSKGVRATPLKITQLVWSDTGDALYYPTYNALDTSQYANPYEVFLYKVSLPELKPRLIMKFLSEEPVFPEEHLESRAIKLYKPQQPLSFGRVKKEKTSWHSPRGGVIGIDEDDVLYYLPHRWWRKRLFRIPRVPIKYDMPRYQYKGGKLAIEDMRWLPSGRYIIMEHDYYGICILDPSRGKVGILDVDGGDTFGWYTKM